MRAASLDRRVRKEALMLVREAHTALDELTQALGLGSVYDFQR